MKKVILHLFVLTSFCFSIGAQAQNPVNWTPRQLMEPAQLAAVLDSSHDLPVIISVGPGAVIPHSIHTGMASNSEGLEAFRAKLKNIGKDQKIVIYCGCCPFEHCPNVRPAIDALKEMKFTNYYLLNLPHNVKADWIDKGYPVSKAD